MRTRLPDRATEPSTKASTFSLRATSASGSCAPLYRIVEAREITRSELTCARLVIRASVTPSAKYSCEESPVRFSNGKTAIAWIRIAWALLENLPFHTFTANPKSNDKTRAAVPHAAHRLRHHGSKARTVVTDSGWSLLDGPRDFPCAANEPGMASPSTWGMNR